MLGPILGEAASLSLPLATQMTGGLETEAERWQRIQGPGRTFPVKKGL